MKDRINIESSNQITDIKFDYKNEIAKHELERKKLETELLELQKKHFNKYSVLLNIVQTVGLPAIIVAIIAFAGTRISNTIQEKEFEMNKFELERRYQLDLTNFLIENSKAIFSTDTNEQNRVKKVMLVSFSKDKIDLIFPKISDALNNDSSNIWLNSTPFLIEVKKLMSSILKNTNVNFYYNGINAKSIKLLNQLENIGFYVTKRTSPYENINTMWFTQDIDLASIKQLTKFLIQNNLISLERIYYSKYENMKNTIAIGNHGIKNNSIQIFTIDDIDSIKTIEVYRDKEPM